MNTAVNTNKIILLLMLAMLCIKGHASSTHLVLVKDGLSNVESREFIAQIKSSVWEADIEEINVISDLDKDLSKKAVLLAIGSNAFQEALESQIEIPIVSIFISRRQYLELKRQHAKTLPPTTAIFSDADINDQISLVTGLYNRSLKIGVLLSDSTEHFKDEIDRFSSSVSSEPGATKEIELQYAKIENQRDLYLAINKFKHLGVDVILALPDSSIYNSQSIRAIILSSHRNKQSIIGFSDKIVKAGALASVYYLPKHIAAETISLIATFFSNDYLSDERYARNFNVAVNRTIAKSLNLYKNNPRELENRVKKNAVFKDKAFEFVYMDTLRGHGV